MVNENISAVTLDDRLEHARALRKQGANCSQCVALAFADKAGIDPATLGKIMSGLGGGIGATGHTCGVVTAMAVIEGLTLPDGLTKAQIYAGTRSLVNEFEEKEGSTECRALKSEYRRDCADLIADGIAMLNRHLADR